MTAVSSNKGRNNNMRLKGGLNSDRFVTISEIVNILNELGFSPGGNGGSAISITFSPNGDITASNVQNAIVEVRDDTDTKLASKANTASPTFTGTPLAPTASLGNNSTQIATTAFVQNVTSGASSVGNKIFNYQNFY